jgi:hypothetical protein
MSAEPLAEFDDQGELAALAALSSDELRAAMAPAPLSRGELLEELADLLRDELARVHYEAKTIATYSHRRRVHLLNDAERQLVQRYRRGWYLDVPRAPRVRQRGTSRQVRPARRTRRATARSPGRLADDDPEPDVVPPAREATG